MKTDFSYQAIIFDLDGVLANTEPGIFRVLQQTIRAYGVEIGTPDYHALFGLDFKDSATYLVKTYSIPETIPALADILHNAVIAHIDQIVEAIPGSTALVMALHQRGIRLGMASNSPCDYVPKVVASLGLTDIFPAPVCRDAVLLGKPAPDPYLEACRRANADPLHCLAIEDSPVGMRSALAAGMDCAVVGGQAPHNLPERASHFSSIAALGNQISGLSGS